MIDKEKFITNDGLMMVKCKPLHFHEQAMFKGGKGPKIYTITVRNSDEHYICFYKPEDKSLLINNFGEASNKPLAFKVKSLKEASEWVNRFAEGMGIDMRDTVFMYHTHQKGEYLIGDDSKILNGERVKDDYLAPGAVVNEEYNGDDIYGMYEDEVDDYVTYRNGIYEIKSEL